MEACASCIYNPDNEHGWCTHLDRHLTGGHNCPDYHAQPKINPAPLRDDFEKITGKARPK